MLSNEDVELLNFAYYVIHDDLQTFAWKYKNVVCIFGVIEFFIAIRLKKIIQKIILWLGTHCNPNKIATSTK